MLAATLSFESEIFDFHFPFDRERNIQNKRYLCHHADGHDDHHHADIHDDHHHADSHDDHHHADGHDGPDNVDDDDGADGHLHSLHVFFLCIN